MLHKNRQNLKAVFLYSGRLLHPPSSMLPICLRTARARPNKTLKAITLPKKIIWILIQINQCPIQFSVRPTVTNLRAFIVLALLCYFQFLFKGKLPVQSLVSCLSWSAYFLISYIFLAKTGTLRIGSPLDWQNIDPSEVGPLRIDKNRTAPNCASSGLAKYRPLRVVIFFYRRPFRIGSHNL